MNSFDLELSMLPSSWEIICSFLVWTPKSLVLLHINPHWSHFVLKGMSSTDSVLMDCFSIPTSDEGSVITVGVTTGAVIAVEDIPVEASDEVATVLDDLDKSWEAAVFAAW